MHLRIAPLFVLFSLPGALAAQNDVAGDVALSWPLDTGRVVNDSTDSQVVAAFSVHVDGAASLRLYFTQLDVGPGELRLSSLLDGAVQTLDAAQCQQWQLSSAYFNGDTVLVELTEPPGGGSGHMQLGRVDVGVPPIEPKSQCGVLDDRVPSSDPRVARLLPVGCSAWIIDDCAHCLLTAGHCTGLIDVVEFNVPFSTLLGTLVHPDPQDQYAVDPLSQQSNGGLGVGNDWAYFGVYPNPVTGLLPGQAQHAWFELAPPPAAASQALRVTGYGADYDPDLVLNQVQQTATGPFTAGWASTLQYQVDTTGGESGSPIVLEQTGRAIGIHTHAGCALTGGANQGTSILNADLQAALMHPAGACRGSCGWTDLGHALAGSFGAPVLTGSGVPLGGTDVTLAVTGLPLAGTTILITGFSEIDKAFKGGVLVPAPDFLVAGLPIALGTCTFGFQFPPGVPEDTAAIFQFWTPDPGAPQGLSASNGLRLVSP